MSRTVWVVVAANIALFIGVTGLPAFRDLHHHWIFPIAAGLLAVEWALMGGLPWSGVKGWAEAGPARAAILSILGFLMLMGIVRHWSILHCADTCSLKLGAGAAAAGVVFFAQARLGDRGLWAPVRARTAALACVLWSVWLALFGAGFTARQLDVGFFALAVPLLLAWRWHAARVVALALPLVLLVRRTGELPVIVLGVVIALGGLALAGRIGAPPKDR